VENFPVGSLPVKSFPAKTFSTRDQNGKLSAGKLSNDKVCSIVKNNKFYVIRTDSIFSLFFSNDGMCQKAEFVSRIILLEKMK
jgi:hypothetical protein